MQLSVNGTDTFVATGGREFDPTLPPIVLLLALRRHVAASLAMVSAGV